MLNWKILNISRIFCNKSLSLFARRQCSSQSEKLKHKNKSTFYYVSGCTLLVGGVTYASVPLYRLYCQSTGKGGKAEANEASNKISKMEKTSDRLVTVRFLADSHSDLSWNFKPQMPEIKVHIGETALAFYTATNSTSRPIIGIATYNILPFQAGMYFNKIQCFCFEEQRLNPHEQVDMPVFFYLDPEFAEDPLLELVDEVVLSYYFFEAKEGFTVPMPEFLKNKP